MSKIVKSIQDLNISEKDVSKWVSDLVPQYAFERKSAGLLWLEFLIAELQRRGYKIVKNEDSI